MRFDPSNTAEILDAMKRIASDEALRLKLAALGPAQAAKFSWEETARITLDAIGKAVT